MTICTHVRLGWEACCYAKRITVGNQCYNSESNAMTSDKNDSIGWLHLTDLHQGLKPQRHLWPNVRARFYEDLEQLHRTCGPWDIVLFTGDLTQRGMPAEFAALTATLNDLWRHLNKLGSDPVLCAVPGNHDLRRPKADSSDVVALRLFHTDAKLRDDFFERKRDGRRHCVTKAFSPFQDWAHNFPAFQKASPRWGLLPGDFSAKLCLPGRLRLGVVGLNSAFLQLTGDDFDGKLTCDVRQLVDVCEGDADRWLSDCDAALLLTHHPLSWLSPTANREFLAEIVRPGRFLAHLYGHVHEPRGSASSVSGSIVRNELQGVSLFGLEHYGGSGGEELQRRHGYSAGRISMMANTAEMSVYPRALISKKDGSFTIAADPSATLQDGAFRLSLPLLRRNSASPSHSPSSARQPLLAANYLDAYRRRLASWFERWDLSSVGLAQADSGAPRILVRLDEMYQPLRFVEQVGRSEPQREASTLTAAELQNSRQPVMVRGAAGAGKTTWLQHCFRALLAKDDTLPLMIVLRDLAQRWQSPDCRGRARSLDAFLQDWVAQNVPDYDSKLLADLLLSDTAPRPVLLIDGWDEVGPLGEELRSKLIGFLQDHPRVLAVVTSRPYGQNPPSHADGFRCFDIAPLTQEDVAALAARFFNRCCGEDAEASQRQQRRFLLAIERSASALNMSRTPLLLVIMLLISRSRPLPDKRHLLYQCCLDGLLSALPDTKQDEGALLHRNQYRPDDSEERLRLVATLAAGPVGTSEFVALVGSAEQLAERLPSEWPTSAPPGMTRQQARLAFVRWLAGPAGLLNERTDGTLTFSHLSFQEYLTAWHLHATIEGAEARAQAVLLRVGEKTWWETLRLWAALIAGQSQSRIAPVIGALIEGGRDGICLAGAILADGLGEDEAFRAWKTAFVGLLCVDWPPTISMVIDGWQASCQEDRLGSLRESVQTLMPHVSIAAWLRLSGLCVRLGWQSIVAKEPAHLGAYALRWLLDAKMDSALELAAGRVLCSSHPLWPGEPLDVCLLHLWPSPRRLLGITLQVAVLCGAQRSELGPLLRGLLCRPVPELTQRATRLAYQLAQDLSLNFGDSLVPELSADWAWQLAQAESDIRADLAAQDDVAGMAKVYLRDWFRPWANHLFHFVDGAGKAQLLPRAQARMHERGLATVLRNEWPYASSWAKDWACSSPPASDEELAEHWQVAPGTSWLKDLGRFICHGSARFGARALTAALTEYEPPIGLMAQACRLALCPTADSTKFSKSLSDYPAAGDPLWPMLARHLAGRSTSQDRTQLEGLVRHPEQRSGPLSWGLRYLARGDVVLHDTRIVTLDELATEAGCPPLPFLQDVQPPPDLISAEQRQEFAAFSQGFWGHLPGIFSSPDSHEEALILAQDNRISPEALITYYLARHR